jgi:hypothetical protein
MKSGRFGYKDNNFYWTYELLTSLSLDIREAYNSQNGVWTPSQADTILINDWPVTGRCAVFYVVASIIDRTSGFKRVYLDRLQPKAAPCTQQAMTKACCPNNSMPDELFLYISNTTGCLEAVFSVVWSDLYSGWVNEFRRPNCGTNPACWMFFLVTCGALNDFHQPACTIFTSATQDGSADGVTVSFTFPFTTQGGTAPPCHQPVDFTVQIAPSAWSYLSNNNPGNCDSAYGTNPTVRLTSFIV